MKRYFVKTNAYNMVVFVDDTGMAYIIHEESFDEPLTIDVAKNADYSNLDGCETADECYWAIGCGDYDRLVIPYSNINDIADGIVQFG